MTPLPVAEFAFPGPLRDKLVEAVLDGSKTSTTGILADYLLHGEELPAIGQRQIVVDSMEQQVGVIETTEVSVIRLADVDIGHARDEGEGYETVVEWRRAHEEFWHSDEMRNAMNDPHFSVNDDTLVVVERFSLIETLESR